MAITFPRELLSYALVDASFVLDRGVITARHHKGLAGTDSQVREPLWVLGFETPPMPLGERKAWSAWLNSITGPGRYFLAWDASLQQPLLYPDGVPSIIATTWDGTATVTGLGTAGAIAVSGVPAGFSLRDGDKVGLVQSGVYGLYEVNETCTASGATTMTVPVQPLVQPMFTTSATAVLYRPKAKFKLDPSSVEIDGSIHHSPVKFRAAQVLV